MNVRKTLLFWILLLFAFPLISWSADPVVNGRNIPRYLFVVNIQSGTYTGNQLVVKATPQVIYFSGRPKHVSGHVLMKHFVAAWNKNGLKRSPPNATLSILSKDGVNNVVIEIQGAKIKNGYVIFTIKVLQGTLPKAFSTASIFIDDVESSDSIEDLLSPHFVGTISFHFNQDRYKVFDA